MPDFAEPLARLITEFKRLPGVGQKSAQAVLAQIENSKNAGLARVLMGLGIPFVGERTAELLASEFGSMDAVSNATVDLLQNRIEFLLSAGGCCDDCNFRIDAWSRRQEEGQEQNYQAYAGYCAGHARQCSLNEAG